VRRLAGVSCVLALLLDGNSVRADDLPDPAAVRQHVIDASGTRPKIERMTIAYHAFGLDGTRVTLRDGDDFRETVKDGPFETQRGSFHGQAWHQNANGQTVLDQPDPGLASKDALVTSIAAITAPITGYVVSALNKRGDGTKQYVDASTWRVVRREVISPTATRTYAYDDFRTANGYTQAWHWTVRDGHAENDADYRIIADEAGAVTAAELAIPAPRRNLVDFPANVSSVALPVREERGQFIVRVNIGSRGLDMILDTGASTIAVDEAVVRQLGLKTYGGVSNAANAGRYTSTSAIVPEMKVGSLTLDDVVVDTIPHLGADSPSDYKIVGLLGFDFIASLVLEFDYQAGTVTAFDPSSFAPPQDPLLNVLPVRLGNGQPMTDVSVNGALAERFIVDTGAAGSVLIFDYFQRRHPEALVDVSGAPPDRVRYLGVGGGFEARRFVLASVKLGRVDFKRFPADAVSSSSAYGGSSDGLIGSEFLRLYTLYTDYQNSLLYLVPNALGRSAIGR
jgi:predicted aspartyl protease